MQLQLDRTAQAFEVMAAMDDALASHEPRLVEGAAGSCDPQRDVLEMLGMGEDGDIAMSEIDQVTRRGVAAGFAIGAHGIETGGFGAAVEQHRRRQSGPISPRANEGTESSLADTTIRPSIRRAISASMRRRSIAVSSFEETSRRS